MKILSVGNSFSVDSQRYVIDIFKADGIQIQLGNLYIGGCSLEQHCANIQSGEPVYAYFKDNIQIGSASILTGLRDENWDIVTLQQASHLSGMPETYYPYIETLAAYVRQNCPQAKIYINETWAYEYDSTHHAFINYNSDRFEMHERLSKAYAQARERINAGFIPVGEAVSIARGNDEFCPEKGGLPLTRDGFHLSYVLGRYLAGAVWYETLTGKSILENSFIPAAQQYLGTDPVTHNLLYGDIPNTQASAQQLKLLKDACHQACMRCAVRCGKE